MKQTIPFSPLPFEVLKKASTPLLGIGNFVGRGLPYLKLELKQAEFKINAGEYGAMMTFVVLFYFAIVSIIMFFLSLRFIPENALLMGLTIGAVIAFLIFIQLSLYPKMLVKKKVRDVERNLVFALRTMLIEIKSGITLFDSLRLIAEGNFGVLSDEFRKAVDEISTGSLEEEALQKLAMQNPSLFLRKALWQVSNGMKAGADISDVMEDLVETMTKEERIQINSYGASLRLLSLMYMMIGVILPAMGITLLIVLSSLVNIERINEVLWGILAMVIVMEFMYIGIMKSRRPNLIGVSE